MPLQFKGPGHRHAAPHYRHFDSAGSRRRQRSAAGAAEDPVPAPRPDLRAHRIVLSRPAEERPAGRRRLGAGKGRDHHAQRHASRRAVSLPPDHGSRARRAQACRHHRPDSAGVVLSAGRKARLPAFRGRLRGNSKGRRDRAQAHRPRTQAAGDRRRQHQRRREVRQAGLRRFRLRHGPGGDTLSHRARRPRHRHRRLELGRAVQLHGEALRERTATRRSSGKATRPAATSATAIWKSCTTSKRCRRPDSPSRAFR